MRCCLVIIATLETIKLIFTVYFHGTLFAVSPSKNIGGKFSMKCTLFFIENDFESINS